MFEQMMIAVVIILLTIIIYRLAYKNINYWKVRNIDGPQPLPFLGNFAELLLMRQHVGLVTQNIYNQFPDAAYVGAFEGTKPTLVIRDPELVKLVMAKDFYYFYSRGIDSDIKQEPMTANLFATSGDFWRLLRHNLTPLFSSAKMRNMFHLVADCGKEFEMFAQERVSANNGEIEIRDFMSRFSIDVIGSCAFGLKLNSIKQQDNSFRRMGYKVFETSILKTLRFLMRNHWPLVSKILNINTFGRTVQDFFIDLSQKSIKSREGMPAERHDFIELLAELKRCGHISGDSIECMKPGAARKTISLELDDNLLAAQSFVFFVAGFETSSTTMSYALYEMAKHPKIQERVHADIDALIEKYKGQITYENIKDAKYLEMVMDDTLRIYPVLASLTRKCTSNYVLPDGKVIEKGIGIHLPVYALHHDPRHYPNPEVFDPERFSPEEKQKRHPYAYIPFGEGHRICIGMRFGKMQVMVGLISVLRHYSVSLTSKTPLKLQFDPKALVTTPTTGIWLKITPRNK